MQKKTITDSNIVCPHNDDVAHSTFPGSSLDRIGLRLACCAITMSIGACANATVMHHIYVRSRCVVYNTSHVQPSQVIGFKRPIRRQSRRAHETGIQRHHRHRRPTLLPLSPGSPGGPKLGSNGPGPGRPGRPGGPIKPCSPFWPSVPIPGFPFTPGNPGGPWAP